VISAITASFVSDCKWCAVAFLANRCSVTDCGICKDDQHHSQDCKASTSADDDSGDSEDEDDVTEADSHASET